MLVLGVLVLSFLQAVFGQTPSSPWLTPLSVQRSPRTSFLVKQVPGDGACLFNALAECLRLRHCGVHHDYDAVTAAISAWLRETSVEVLTRDEELVADSGSTFTTGQLLRMVAEHYNTTEEDYCAKMRLQHTWGGGPEIVALSNYLRTPIHVYDLVAAGLFFKSFRLRLSAKFGSPNFDEERPIFILCCDGRYPNIRPGEQIAVGDHFMALFPIPRRMIRRDWGTAVSPEEVLGEDYEGSEVGFRSNPALQRILDSITAKASALQRNARKLSPKPAEHLPTQ